MEKHPEWKDTLFYPCHYEYVPDNQINGAGPRRFGFLIRDKIGFPPISIQEAANIHDAYYFQGRMSRRYCDKVFLHNMNKIISIKGKSYMQRSYAKVVAYSYYRAVRMFGWAFYKRS